MEEIKLLKKEFIGRGEVKGFIFRQIYMNDKFYVYEVTDKDEAHTKVYYELIKRYTNISFDRQYLQECYPSAKMFGIKGWTYPSLERTVEGIKKKFDIDINFSDLL